VLGYVFSVLRDRPSRICRVARRDTEARHMVPRSSWHPRLPAYAVRNSNPIVAKATGRLTHCLAVSPLQANLTYRIWRNPILRSTAES